MFPTTNGGFPEDLNDQFYSSQVAFAIMGIRRTFEGNSLLSWAQDVSNSKKLPVRSNQLSHSPHSNYTEQCLLIAGMGHDNTECPCSV